jgi:LmbE family N-acetylglucosaminyl deacetylase
MSQAMIFSGRKVCFIGAHPDDVEIGSGALISHISSLTEVVSVTLSDNQKNPLLKNVVAEHRRSMDHLGVKPENVIIGDFETRRFPHQRQEILEYLIKLNQSHRPDIVFTHTRADIHQDHATTTEECLRAFRGVTVLGFDVLRSTYGFFPHFLAEVDEVDLQNKLDALAEYKTYEGKYYFDPDITRSTLVRHGALAERKYAEGFDILRIVGAFGCVN